MGDTKGMQLVSSRTEGLISSQVVESRGPEKKSMPELELSATSSDKKRCFACHDTLHNLEQCRTKYTLIAVPHQFGYATKYPFTMIQPSEEMVEKEKFYQHCVLVTSNLSNLDQGILKSELQKFWKLSSEWELRRECSKNFLASFSSEDDIISCLKHPKMETLLDDKEVKLTVTRWNEGDEESLDLIEEWVFVRGVRRIYRNWNELYQVASAFGVLIDVDEKSLEAGDNEPIRLNIALRSLDDAPFSYYFAFGLSSRLVLLTVAQDKVEGMQRQNKESDKEHSKELNPAQSIFPEEPGCVEESRLAGEIKGNEISDPEDPTASTMKTTMDGSKPEDVQPVGQSSTSMIGEEHFEGKPKPPIRHVFKRRGKQQQVITETEDIDIYGSFSDMGLHEKLLKGIYQYGLEKPSAVHQRGIVPFCNGLSVIHESLSGTTVTLCSGVLQRLDYESAECQALIIVPTRDLMYETEKVFEALGQFLGVKAYTCTGGTSFRVNRQTLSSSSRVQVVIGTPGRILDLLARDALCKDHIRMLVLDEADELLTKRFQGPDM